MLHSVSIHNIMPFNIGVVFRIIILGEEGSGYSPLIRKVDNSHVDHLGNGSTFCTLNTHRAPSLLFFKYTVITTVADKMCPVIQLLMIMTQQWPNATCQQDK